MKYMFYYGFKLITVNYFHILIFCPIFALSKLKTIRVMKTNYREVLDTIVRVINKKYNIDMCKDKSEVAVYARVYLAKRLTFMNMSNKYIATIFGVKPSNVSNMVNLTPNKYNKETYLKYRDKFKKLEEKDKDRNFGYIPVYDGEYNESFFESKDASIKRAIHLFRYLCAKTDERILTTDKPIKVSFRQCEKLHICLSMSYNGKLYEREYYCTNFGVSIVLINNN